MQPSLIAFFSASVLRCFGAATIVASTICPPMARKPAWASAASKRLNRTSIADLPSTIVRVSASRKFQIEFASGTRSASVSPRNRMNDKRSLIRYSVRSSVIIGRPPALRPIAPGRGALKISSKDFKIDDLFQPLEIVALRGNVFQSLVDIEKTRLSDHPDPLPKQAKRITKSR